MRWHWYVISQSSSSKWSVRHVQLCTVIVIVTLNPLVFCLANLLCQQHNRPIRESQLPQRDRALAFVYKLCQKSSPIFRNTLTQQLKGNRRHSVHFSLILSHPRQHKQPRCEHFSLLKQVFIPTPTLFMLSWIVETIFDYVSTAKLFQLSKLP